MNKCINNFEDDNNSIELYFNDNINNLNVLNNSNYLNDVQVRESDVIAVKNELIEVDKIFSISLEEKETLLKDIENLNIRS